MGQDVFISYKSEEFQEADWVRQQLESGGISCWMAPNSITGGASYATEIPQAIRSRRVAL
ncbi:MAG: toll/interleukin-1 receptor domain-containing protein [Vescimonas sp.]